MLKCRNLHLLLALCVASGIGCAFTQKEDEFFTSGNPEADRRGSGKVSDKKTDSAKTAAKGKTPIEERATLYQRLGGEERIRLIVDDFVKRVLEDPRVNFSRKGVTKGGLFRRDRSVEWNPTAQNVQRLKDHFVQFISLAAGGPAQYSGQPIKRAHADMQITKAEFDATIGDLKATLDKLDVPSDVQKDLLAIFESTRPQIVPEK